MDSSSKKIVMIIAAATLAIIAVMAFNNYNMAEAEKASVDTTAPAPVDPQPATVATPAPAPQPANGGPVTESVQAIDGSPSMILDNEGSNNLDGNNKDAPVPTDDTP